MSEALSKEAKKEVMKDIILKLHAGLSAEEAKERFEREVGNIGSTEIAELEQGLINEGLSPEEIKRFCNVHAMIFQSALEKASSEDTFPSHPVYLFKLENREIERRTGSLKEVIAMAQRQQQDLSSLKASVKELLLDLRGIGTHYRRKEQLLFPFLEKQGFMGPSKVMWGKDNEIRDLLKAALANIDNVHTPAELDSYAEKVLDPLIEEVEGMVFKEENILFPTSLEKLEPGDWVQILRESDEVGYVFVQKPAETEVLTRDLQAALVEEATYEDRSVAMPSGTIRLNELTHLLNALPVDLTFVDKDDTVRYFTEGNDRAFSRTRSVIGRKVQNCHPPQSLDVVQKILNSFKERKRDSADFWINYKGRLVYIRYLAVRDQWGRYLGTLEVTQDITGIKDIEGEKRLLDERD